MKLKTRIKCQHFVDGNAPVGSAKVTASWIVEVCIDRRWSPMGDKGITRYATKEAAQAAAVELATKEITFA